MAGRRLRNNQLGFFWADRLGTSSITSDAATVVRFCSFGDVTEIVSDHPDIGELHRAAPADGTEGRISLDEADRGTSWAHGKPSEH